MKHKRKKTVADLDLRVGIAIKRLRESMGMTQSELAKRSQVSQACISLIENGLRNTRLNLKMLQSISHVLGQRRLSDLVRFAEDIPEAKDVIARAHRYGGLSKRNRK